MTAGSAMAPSPLTILGSTGAGLSVAAIDLFLETAFSDAGARTALRGHLDMLDGPIADSAALIAALEGVISVMGRERASLRYDPSGLAQALDAVKQRMATNAGVYQPKGKPNPNAVFWPNPTRRTGSSVFNMLPAVANLGLVTPETPVGSAGSCFAMEIAYELQSRGFNYVTTEHEADGIKRGVIMGDYRADNPYARFCATWGLLFNSPSFRQLAEKAFETRTLPRLLIGVSDVQGRPLYADPFREGVFFASQEAFEADYELHAEAVRQALLQSRVFVITLGLNECWEYVPDGSVLSRNPREKELLALVRPRVLTIEENIAHVQAFIDIVRAHNPDFTLVISVSPVPFMATTRGHTHHVVAANGHSKAVLRIAAQELARSNRDAFYFPSYEQVTVCTPEPWDSDHRHVSRDAVAGVMRLFDAMFVKGSS